jgi:regulator of replication initiation timing
MTPDEMVNLLMSFERRLATLADQAHETREQAQHTLDRINRLRRDLELVKDRLTSSIDTINYVPLSPDTLR